MPLQVGQTIAEFEILAKLGQGGMGHGLSRPGKSVLNRVVAVKVLSPALGGRTRPTSSVFQSEAADGGASQPPAHRASFTLPGWRTTCITSSWNTWPARRSRPHVEAPRGPARNHDGPFASATRVAAGPSNMAGHKVSSFIANIKPENIFLTRP